jgi:hypothetical protein
LYSWNSDTCAILVPAKNCTFGRAALSVLSILAAAVVFEYPAARIIGRGAAVPRAAAKQGGAEPLGWLLCRLRARALLEQSNQAANLARDVGRGMALDDWLCWHAALL